MLNIQALSELFRRVMAISQRPPVSLQLVYLIGATSSNQSSLLNKAAEMKVRLAVPGLEGLEEVCDYAGARAWKRELVTRGLTARQIISLPSTLVQVGDKMSFNALIEQEDLARYAKTQRFTHVGFIAPRFQLLRSFMGAVTACKRHYPELRVYPIEGTPLLWDEEAAHSQGTLVGIRADLMFHETVRIFTYQEKGDLPSAEDALEYLERLQLH